MKNTIENRRALAQQVYDGMDMDTVELIIVELLEKEYEDDDSFNEACELYSFEETL